MFHILSKCILNIKNIFYHDVILLIENNNKNKTKQILYVYIYILGKNILIK